MVHERVGGQPFRIRVGDHPIVGSDVCEVARIGSRTRPRVRVVGGDARESGPQLCRLLVRVVERAAFVRAEPVLVQREAVHRPADADGRGALEVGSERRHHGPGPGWRPGHLDPRPPCARRRPGALGACEQHHACVTDRDPRRRRVQRADRRLTAGRQHPPTRRCDLDTEARRDQPSQVVVGPTSHGHELEPVEFRQRATAGVGVGRARGGEDQRERLRRGQVVVVPMRDLPDADDDRDGRLHRVLALKRSSRHRARESRPT